MNPVVENGTSTTNYILCLPRGGLNDIISVIWRCREYAISHKRILVIDTTDSFMKEDIRDYFVLKCPHVYQGPLSDFYSLNVVSTFPASFHGKLNIAKPICYDARQRCYTYMGQSTAIDISKRCYTEQVIVYCNNGFATYMKQFLGICELSCKVRDTIYNRLSIMKRPYTGIHIRNTDIKSDVKNFIKSRLQNLRDRDIFLASDNSCTISHVKSFLESQGCSVHTFANIPTYIGKCIHYNHQGIETEDFNIDVITDLMLLILADTYIYSSTTSGFSKGVEQARSCQKVVSNLKKSISQTISQ